MRGLRWDGIRQTQGTEKIYETAFEPTYLSATFEEHRTLVPQRAAGGSSQWYVPKEQGGDYSDVKVVSPYGEIPWNGLARLDDEEMKTLMIDLVNKVFTVLNEVVNRDELLLDYLSEHVIHPEWHQPKINPQTQMSLDVAFGRKTPDQAIEESKALPSLPELPSEIRKREFKAARFRVRQQEEVDNDT
jgi:hypothetical protein